MNLRTISAVLCLLAPFAHAGEAEVEEVLDRAEAAYARALELEHGWSVTEPLMEEARAALAAGEVDRAQEIAERALLTAEQAVLQAEHEAEAWRGRTLGG
jgi:hypothetical protein